MVVFGQPGPLPQQQLQITLHEAIVQSQPQPGSAAANVCIDKDELFQFQDNISEERERKNRKGCERLCFWPITGCWRGRSSITNCPTCSAMGSLGVGTKKAVENFFPSWKTWFPMEKKEFLNAPKLNILITTPSIPGVPLGAPPLSGWRHLPHITHPGPRMQGGKFPLSLHICGSCSGWILLGDNCVSKS